LLFCSSWSPSVSGWLGILEWIKDQRN
jgi:hypothetical protein